jgi:hypothetical protein
MICPECNGKGEAKYYREVDRDAYSVTVEGYLDICHACHGIGIKVQTNADHIRSMTDEELAVWISALYTGQYHIHADPHYWEYWLMQEVE